MPLDGESEHNGKNATGRWVTASKTTVQHNPKCDKNIRVFSSTWSDHPLTMTRVRSIDFPLTQPAAISAGFIARCERLDASMTSSATVPRSRSDTPQASRGPSGLALAVADVGWFNTENLFREIDRQSVAVLLLKCQDYVNGWRRGLFPWSRACRLRRRGPGAWEQQLVLPSGWMKRFPRIGMRPIARSIRAWWQTLPPSWRRGLVMSYPHYLYLHEQLRPDVSIYYNIDDYSLYWPRGAARIRELERATVLAADATVCVSRLRAEELQASIPEAAGRIHHVPHGTPTPFLAPYPLARPADPPGDLAHLPRPYLGYIGSLENRLDWNLLDKLSREFPESSLVVVGRVPDPVAEPWWHSCSRFLSRPNVHALGWRPQDEIARYYQAFDVCLIPYRIDHPFNRVCNPTKIMDAMGSGRPIVATALPECRLHAERFHVVENDDQFIAAVRAILASHSDDGRSALRHEYARANTCHGMAERILALLDAACTVAESCS
jgi:glycosyltransferase involved in cell wall biosynthesis